MCHMSSGMNDFADPDTQSTPPSDDKLFASAFASRIPLLSEHLNNCEKTIRSLSRLFTDSEKLELEFARKLLRNVQDTISKTEDLEEEPSAEEKTRSWKKRQQDIVAGGDASSPVSIFIR